VALEVDSGTRQDIWNWDSIRENRTLLTFGETSDARPIWTTDGKGIVFSSARDGNFAIYQKAADTTGKIEQLASAQDRLLFPSSLSNDGKTLLTWELGNAGSDIGMMSMEGDRTRKTLLQEKYDELDPQISPDGRWMAYTSNESGKDEVYVRPFPDVDSGGRWHISTNGGNSPLWSPDGSELFYISGYSVMAVSVETEPTFKHETPKTLFVTTTDYFGGYDIHPDGKRFLMMKFAAAPGDESADGSPPKIKVVLNWFEELKEKVPTN
jgi:serine/threonine-protein kinase